MPVSPFLTRRSHFPILTSDRCFLIWGGGDRSGLNLGVQSRLGITEVHQLYGKPV
ncbi:MAG: hypothetical protein ACKN9E_19475 [Microcystaceae cyanobacterium]